MLQYAYFGSSYIIDDIQGIDLIIIVLITALIIQIWKLSYMLQINKIIYAFSFVATFQNILTEPSFIHDERELPEGK